MIRLDQSHVFKTAILCMACSITIDLHNPIQVGKKMQLSSFLWGVADSSISECQLTGRHTYRAAHAYTREINWGTQRMRCKVKHVIHHTWVWVELRKHDILWRKIKAECEGKTEADEWQMVFLCLCHFNLRFPSVKRIPLYVVASLTHSVTTHAGAPPGAELVQCEIKWVIKILREARRDCIPFNVPVENIWMIIHHACFVPSPCTTTLGL